MKNKNLTLTEDMFNALKNEKDITGESVNTIIRAFIKKGLKNRKNEKENKKGVNYD